MPVSQRKRITAVGETEQIMGDGVIFNDRDVGAPIQRIVKINQKYDRTISEYKQMYGSLH